MSDALALVRELVAIPGPPGQEDAVREAVAAHAERLGCPCRTDARGNLLIGSPGEESLPDAPSVVVMAHLDEIALLVTRVADDGCLSVAPLGGAFPWKWGEGPVSVLAAEGEITGILSFGSIHSSDGRSGAVRAKDHALTWDMARVWTGQSGSALLERGVRPGTRAVLHPFQRLLIEFGDYVSAPFLDDRADLAAMLVLLEGLRDRPLPEGLRGKVLFAATAAEEVGGHGALFLLHRYQPTYGVALEVGPNVLEAPLTLDAQPTVWVNDSYSAMRPADIALVAEAARGVGLAPHFQALARGGSDASCAAAQGLVARPVTLAFGAENSHGHEIMHRGAVDSLARLTDAVLRALPV